MSVFNIPKISTGKIMLVMLAWVIRLIDLVSYKIFKTFAYYHEAIANWLTKHM